MAASALPDRLADLARDHALRNSLGQGAYVLDQEGRLVDMNPAAERLLGWTADELRGRDMHAAVHHSHPDGSPFPRETCPLLAVVESGVEFAETYDTFFRRDGRALPVSYVSSPVTSDGRIVGAVLAFWVR